MSVVDRLAEIAKRFGSNQKKADELVEYLDRSKQRQQEFNLSEVLRIVLENQEKSYVTDHTGLIIVANLTKPDDFIKEFTNPDRQEVNLYTTFKDGSTFLLPLATNSGD